MEKLIPFSSTALISVGGQFSALWDMTDVAPEPMQMLTGPDNILILKNGLWVGEYTVNECMIVYKVTVPSAKIGFTGAPREDVRPAEVKRYQLGGEKNALGCAIGEAGKAMFAVRHARGEGPEVGVDVFDANEDGKTPARRIRFPPGAKPTGAMIELPANRILIGSSDGGFIIANFLTAQRLAQIKHQDMGTAALFACMAPETDAQFCTFASDRLLRVFDSATYVLIATVDIPSRDKRAQGAPLAQCSQFFVSV